MRSVLNGPRVAQQPRGSQFSGQSRQLDGANGGYSPSINNDLGAPPSSPAFDPLADDALAPPAEATLGDAPPPLPQTQPGTPSSNALRNSEFQPTPADPASQPQPQPQPQEPESGQMPTPLTPDAAPQPPFSLAPQETPADDEAPRLPDFGNGLRRETTDPDCDQVYNGRDCCKEAEKCKKARNLLESTTIHEISLDITPKFKPDLRAIMPRDQAAKDASVAAEVARERAFENMDLRDWKGRDGRVLTRGKLVDYVKGRAYVEMETGEIVRIPYKELSQDDNCFLAAWWQIPSECSLAAEQYTGRHWVGSTMTWKASGLCHKPLYFEEVQLERYGHTTGRLTQPIVSGAHFFFNIAVMPYKMGIHPPRECQYALGYYRPGSCAPWLIPPVPLSVRGGLAQAAAVVGGIYIFP